MSFRKKDGGSLVVEASLILPFFLAFVLGLMTMIHISVVEMSLDHAVSESTKQVSTHMYPVKLLLHKTGESQNLKYVKEVLKTSQYVYSLLDMFQSKKQYTAITRGDSVLSRDPVTTMAEPFVKPILFNHLHDLAPIKESNIELFRVTLPNFNQPDHVFFGIEIQYNMPLQLPFIDKTISIHKKAFERVWVGKKMAHQPSDKKPISLTLHPESIQRGHDMRVQAVLKPHTRASIKIVYPSGHTSTAKGLTSKISDSNGRVGWTWLVSGNTKAGTAHVIVMCDGNRLQEEFEVMARKVHDKRGSTSYVHDRHYFNSIYNRY